MQYSANKHPNIHHSGTSFCPARERHSVSLTLLETAQAASGEATMQARLRPGSSLMRRVCREENAIASGEERLQMATG